jgi:hypothetical protein
VIFTIPAVASNGAEMLAVNWFWLTKVVGSALPFHLAIAPVTKPLPLIVRVNGEAPAVTVFGSIEVITGATMVTSWLLDDMP